jgi:hypothetical protein
MIKSNPPIKPKYIHAKKLKYFSSIMLNMYVNIYK